MCLGKSPYFSDALQSVGIQPDDFVPLWLVPDEVNLHCDLCPALLIMMDLNDASRAPFTHLIEHINSIINLEVHALAPLLLDAQC